MSSIASGQHLHSRSRLSSVVLLATLVLTMPSVLQPQTTGTSDGPPRQDDVPAPRETTTKRTAPPRQTKPPTPRDSSFLQRFVAAIAEGLANTRARDSLRRDSLNRLAQQPRMPDVVGMDTAAAIRALRTLRRFELSISYVIAPPPPTSIPVDRIAAQLPSAGTPLSRAVGARFTLAGVPRPPDSVTVPRVIGLLADDAVRTLRGKGLVEQKLEKGVTAPDSIGRVTGQNPVAGTRRAVGGLVAIAIGQDARVLMPKVTGLPLATARQRIQVAGIDVRRVRRDSVDTTRSIGLVVRQRPAAGSVVLPTTPIVLTQAVRTPQRPDTVARMAVMPMVVGRDSATADSILRAAGLRNRRIRVPVNTAAVDTVRAQTPDSGRRIPATTVVVLTLGAPTPVDPVPLPALVDAFPEHSRWFPWLAAIGIALAVAAAGAIGGRTIWPPPQIVPRITVQPGFAEVAGVNGSLVDVSVSLRSHVEHERSVLDLTGSPLE